MLYEYQVLASLAGVNQKKNMFEFSQKASLYNYSNVVVDGVKIIILLLLETDNRLHNISNIYRFVLTKL